MVYSRNFRIKRSFDHHAVWSLALGTIFTFNSTQARSADAEGSSSSGASARILATRAAEMPPEPVIVTTKHDVSVAADFMLGKGDVSLPFNFSLGQSLGGEGAIAKSKRNTDFAGGALSYSYLQAWYLDVAFAREHSTGLFDVPLPGITIPGSHFSVNGSRFQTYVRYAFPSLRGRVLSAYVRAGVNYMDSRFRDRGELQTGDSYSQENKSHDILGNLGLGATLNWHPFTRAQLGLQFETEGFYGHRSQVMAETVIDSGGPTAGPDVSFGNNLYGVIGRSTVHMSYELGRRRRLNVFTDIGVQSKLTFASYRALGRFSELLWGPYGRIGLSYSF